MDNQIKVAVLLFNGVELVDMNGPIDVFQHANSYNGKRYDIYTVAATMDLISSEGNIVTMTPQYDISNCPVPDVIVIPGIIDLEADQSVVDWITPLGKQGKTILSVCIGLYTLARTGLLSGRQATTHYLAIDSFHEQYPDVHLVKNVRFVEDKNIVSTAGVTSGIDGALHLVEQYDGSDIAQQTSDVLVYNREAPLPRYTILPPYYSS